MQGCALGPCSPKTVYGWRGCVYPPSRGAACPAPQTYRQTVTVRSTVHTRVTVSLKTSSPGRLQVVPDTLELDPGQEAVVAVRLHILQVRWTTPPHQAWDDRGEGVSFLLYGVWGVGRGAWGVGWWGVGCGAWGGWDWRVAGSSHLEGLVCTPYGKVLFSVSRAHTPHPPLPLTSTHCIDPLLHSTSSQTSRRAPKASGTSYL
jgi:hypothetical protein